MLALGCFIGAFAIAYTNNHLPEGEIFYMHEHQTEGDFIKWTNLPKLKVHGQLTEPPNVGDILIYITPSDETFKFQFSLIKKMQKTENMFFGRVKLIGEINTLSTDSE